MISTSSKERYSKIWKLALPVIVQDVCIMLLAIADTAMVGHLGPVAIAAVAINTAPIWLINGIGSALAIGGGSMISRSIGAKEQENANIVASVSTAAMLVIGVLTSILFLIFARQLTVSMGASPEVIDLAARYVRIIGGAQVFQYLLMILSAVFRSIGDFKTPMKMNILMCVLNVVLDFFFIFPDRLVSIGSLSFTIPGLNLGVEGDAWGTALGILTAFVGSVILLRRKKNHITISITHLCKARFTLLKKIFQIVFPVLLERIVTSVGQMVFFRLIADLGTVTVAANSLAINVEALSYTPVYGFAAAAQTLTGMSLGAGDTEDAIENAKVSFRMGLAYMSLFGLLFLIIPQIFLILFTSDSAVIDVGSHFVRIMAMMQPFFASLIIFNGVLNGAGDTAFTMKCAFLCKGLIRIGTTLLFMSVFHLGAIGAWLSMATDQCLQGILVYIRFRTLKWVKTGGILDQT